MEQIELKDLLKSCPFCGNKAETIKADTGYFVECSECSCKLGYYVDADGASCGYFLNKQDAVLEWNKRVQKSFIELCENLKEARKEYLSYDGDRSMSDKVYRQCYFQPLADASSELADFLIDNEQKDS